MFSALYFMQCITALQSLFGDIDLSFLDTDGMYQQRKKWVWEMCTKGWGITDTKGEGICAENIALCWRRCGGEGSHINEGKFEDAGTSFAFH